MTLFQDLQIAEVIVGDVVSFAAGQPLAASKSFDGVTVSGSVVHLPDGPTAQFPAISGVYNILTLALEGVSGMPISVAEKVGNTWLGYTLTVRKATS